MARCEWSGPALQDILDISDYIARDNPVAAFELTEKLVRTIESLRTEHPSIGRAGRIHETRELVIPDTPYIAAYRVKDGDVEVLRVLHGAREWPNMLCK